MNTNLSDVIVIGAGHAGLCASYFLKQHAIDHLVLERGSIGESWASQRWESFQMNTANKLNTLPGCEPGEKEADHFGTATSFVESMIKYVKTHQLPVLTNTTVISLEKAPGSGLFLVRARQHGTMRDYYCRQVIIASGAQSQKHQPSLAAGVDANVHQLHSSEYRSPSNLPGGGILIVGSAQSGCQIAEELVRAGRTVYLSTSNVPRCPRHYRGKDIMDWLICTGFFNSRFEDIIDPAQLHLKTPLLKGTGNGRSTLSLQFLAKIGVVLVGRLENIKGGEAYFSTDTATHIRFADGFSMKVKRSIDAFIQENQIPAPPAALDPDDEPDDSLDLPSKPMSLSFGRDITTVIWATGFRQDLSFIQLPVFDDAGSPVHQQGVSSIDGLYFLGLPWLKSRKSSLLFGIKEDAQFIANCIHTVARNGDKMSSSIPGSFDEMPAEFAPADRKL